MEGGQLSQEQLDALAKNKAEQGEQKQGEQLSHDDLVALVKKQGSIIADMQKVISAGTQIKLGADKQKPKIPKNTVKVEGKEYKWRAAVFSLGGQRITAEEASLDQEILKKLIAVKGQGILQELV